MTLEQWLESPNIPSIEELPEAEREIIREELKETAKYYQERVDFFSSLANGVPHVNCPDEECLKIVLEEIPNIVHIRLETDIAPMER